MTKEEKNHVLLHSMWLLVFSLFVFLIGSLVVYGSVHTEINDWRFDVLFIAFLYIFLFVCLYIWIKYIEDRVKRV